METDDLTTLTTARNTNNKWAAWILTWNNHSPDDLNMLKTYVTEKCKNYRLQEEIGENGTPHIQGALYFNSRRTLSAIKKDLPKVHLEPSDNWNRIKNYCSKSNTRNGETFEKGQRTIKDPLEGKELYDWQEEILTIIETKPNDRVIYWFWDKNGNIGKTSLAKHICIKNKNALYLTGKSSDMKYGVFQALENGIDVNVILLDFTRSRENFISWEGIEEIKNGIFYNTKYECKMCIYDNPHIICFANYEPDKTRLSEDRWIIRDLTSPIQRD